MKLRKVLVWIAIPPLLLMVPIYIEMVRLGLRPEDVTLVLEVSNIWRSRAQRDDVGRQGHTEGLGLLANRRRPLIHGLVQLIEKLHRFIARQACSDLASIERRSWIAGFSYQCVRPR